MLWRDTWAAEDRQMECIDKVPKLCPYTDAVLALSGGEVSQAGWCAFAWTGKPCWADCRVAEEIAGCHRS
jgi:hypothetical protein